MTIHLVDYGAGNLTSVQKGLTAAGAHVSIVRRAGELDTARAVVIPGVGHFGATAVLDDPWRLAIAARLERGASLLGICLGMQWLFEGSDEASELSGAGLLSGRCFRLPGPIKVPHVGWNTLSVTRPSTRLLVGVSADASVYFTHSFAAPATPDASATSSHGVTFAACVERGRVWGTQFHPEKSGRVGMQMLANFVKAAAERH